MTVKAVLPHVSEKRSVVYWLSAEKLLERSKSNGGDIIFYRSFLITLSLYLLSIPIASALTGKARMELDFSEFLKSAGSSLPVAGAVFAGVYAALYARFSAQWSYLAGVYNQIKASQVALGHSSVTECNAMIEWKAGFIEDAEVLHLSGKPIFKGVIGHWLESARVQRAIRDLSPNGTSMLAGLLAIHQLSDITNEVDPALEAIPQLRTGDELADPVKR